MSTSKSKSALDSSETVLILRTCAADMTSHKGFRWPTSGFVEAPDWNPSPVCGGGLHGLLWGAGSAGHLKYCDAPGAKWIVFSAKAQDVAHGSGDMIDKCKAARGNVEFCGDKDGALAHLLAGGADPSKMVYSTLTGGDRSTLTGGDCSTLTGGDRSTLTGGDDGSTLTGGDRSTLTGGDYSTLTGGTGSTLTGGPGSTLTGGDYSTLTGGGYSTLTGGNRSTLTGGTDSTLTGGDYSTLTGGGYSTLTGGYRSTLTGGTGSTLTGGDGSTLTGGNRSTLTGGDGSTLTGGDYSTLTGGTGSTLTGGPGSTLTGGDRSEIRIRYWDGDRYRTRIGYIGEDGLEPNKKFRLDGDCKFQEVA